VGQATSKSNEAKSKMKRMLGGATPGDSICLRSRNWALIIFGEHSVSKAEGERSHPM